MSKFHRSDLPYSLVILCFIFVWLGSEPVIYEWFIQAENGLLIKEAYRFFDKRALVNIPICFALVYAMYRWCKRIWEDKDIRFFRPLLSILGLIILLCESKVAYAHIWGCVDYKWFISILLFVSLCVMMIKGGRIFFANVQHTKKSEDPALPGFSDDSIDENLIPDSLKNYATVIAERLLATKVNSHSYAIGVTGEWGVGKTTFLKALKSNIQGKAEVVDFNPWMCRSPEQVTQDFFASLRKQLSPIYSSLSRPIREYAQYINTIRFTFPSFLSVHTSPIKDNSLYEKKRILSEQFCNLPHPVVVFIDDIDRLESEEVFEVLRLIRNTADLSNLYYIVAYDKDYVTGVLAVNHIKDSSAYLEKIFPIEVHLPKIEESLVWDTFSKEIDLQSNISGLSSGLIDRLNQSDKELIIKVLNNYRRVKRFVRLYTLNYSYLSKHLKREVRAMDLFWLELIQVYDKKCYDTLANDPDSLLFLSGPRFVLRKGIISQASEKESTNQYKGERFWKDDTPKMLSRLFGPDIETKKQSLCFVDNFDNYFTLSLSPFRVSFKELNELFDDKNIPEEVVKKWLDGGKYFSSIANRLNQVPINRMQEKRLKALVTGTLYFCLETVLYRYNSIEKAKRVFELDHYSTDQTGQMHGIVIDWFKKKINDSDDLLKVSKLLKRFYVTEEQEIEEYDAYPPSFVIDNKEIESLLVATMETYLKRNPNSVAVDVLNMNTGIAKLFENCCVVVKSSMDLPYYCEYKQVAFDTVIKAFAKSSKKPSLKEYEQAYERLFNSHSELNQEPDEETADEFERRMQEYFGCSYNEQLEEFKSKCFES